MLYHNYPTSSALNKPPFNSFREEFAQTRFERATELRRTAVPIYPMRLSSTSSGRLRARSLTENTYPFNKIIDPTSLQNLSNTDEDINSSLVTLLRDSSTPESIILQVSNILQTDERTIYHFISNLVQQVNKSSPEARKIIEVLTTSTEFVESIISTITDLEESPQIEHKNIQKAIFNVISLLFPISHKNIKDIYIDSGICFSILNTLSEKLDEVDNILSMPLAGSCLNLVYVLSCNSYYARDSILSLGIHDLMIQLIQSVSEILVNQGISETTDFNPDTDLKSFLIFVSTCFQKVFSDLKDTDRQIIFDTIPQIINLLNIKIKEVQIEMILILLSIVRTFPSTVFLIFSINSGEITDHIFTILQNLDGETITEDLVIFTLKLLGNLCQSKPSDIAVLYSSGICNILSSLMINQRVTTEVLWVLSNLYEVITDQMIAEITPEFIHKLIGLANSCDLNCKLEVGYFFSTIIIFSPQTMTKNLIVEDIIDIIVDIIACSQYNIANRAVNAIARLVHFAQLTNEYEPLLSFLEISDLKDRLRELLDDDSLSVWLDNRISLSEFYTVIDNLLKQQK